MKIFVNKKIRLLFVEILLSIGIAVGLVLILTVFTPWNWGLWIFVCLLGMGFVIFSFLYQYFKKQHEEMEQAVTTINSYISGNQNARIVCDEEGEIYRLFHEVNALAAALNAQAEVQKSKKDFLKNTISDISHQLKTPLAALNIYNGIMQEEAKKIPSMMEFLSLSEQELDRMETLVQNLLKITKFDAGTIVIEKHEENVADMMNSIEKKFSYRARQEEKEIVLVGDDMTSLLCDRSWVMEAVSNIVKNALDHTDKGNRIQIEWKQLTSMVQIKISDNGSGIHPDDLYHIFKRFYRSRFSTDTQGIGLGLSLAKTIIEAHDGTIQVDSELGMGSTFTIHFLIPTKL